jgi:hypothetical protein
MHSVVSVVSVATLQLLNVGSSLCWAKAPGGRLFNGEKIN